MDVFELIEGMITFLLDSLQQDTDISIVSMHPIWDVKQSPQLKALEIGNQGVNLPSGVCLSRRQVECVCENIPEILTNGVA